MFKHRAVNLTFGVALVLPILSTGTVLAQVEPTEPLPEAPPAPPAQEPANASELAERLHDMVGRPGGLTAQKASRRASSSSYQIRQADSEVNAAAAEQDAAAVGFAPKVTLTARYTRLSSVDQGNIGGGGALVATTQEGPVAPGQPLFGVNLSFPQVLNQYLLQANVTVPLSDYFLRTNHAYSASGHTLQAARQRRKATQRSVAFQAKLAYYNWARAKLGEVVAQRTLEQSQAHLKVVKASFNAGTMAKADVLRFEAQVANAELAVERARAQGEVNAEQIRTLLHDPVGTPYTIGEDLLAPLPAPKHKSFGALLSEAERNRPEIKAYRESARALERQRKATRAGQLPRLDAFANGYYSNPNQRAFPQTEKWTASWDAGLQLTYVLNDIPGAGANAAAVDARRAGVEAQSNAFKDALRQDLSSAQQNVLESEVALSASQRAATASEESYRVRVEQFRAGRATTVELLDADTELLRSRLELISAHINRRVARAQLDYVLGRKQ